MALNMGGAYKPPVKKASATTVGRASTAWSAPKPSYIQIGGTQNTATPKPTTPDTPPQQTYVAPQQQQYYEAPSGGGGGYEGGGGGSTTGGTLQDYIAQIQSLIAANAPQSSNWTPPEAPQEPQVTQSQIAEWQARAMAEAGTTYDPQILSIQQQLDKSVLAAQQTKSGITPSYQEVLDNIAKWQEDTTKAEQGRAYARGFGQGGGLQQTEADTAKEALKQQTSALTQKATAIGNVDAQIQQLQDQAGQQTTGAQSAKAQYVTSRQADLEDTYKQNKSQLDQQKFANEMSIQQFGLTKETQTFSNWLSSMSLATDMWYKDQSLSLDKMAQELGAQANTEALNWDKEKFNTSNAIDAANLANYNASKGSGGGTASDKYGNMILDPETGTYITTSQYYSNKGNAWEMQQAEDAKKAAANIKKPSMNYVGSATSTKNAENQAMAEWIATQNLKNEAATLGYRPSLGAGVGAGIR